MRELTELAQQTDKSLLLAGQALESLRQKRRILPALSVIDRAARKPLRGHWRVYRALVEPLTDSHRAKLDELLAQGRQQHHLVDLAAPGTAETQLPAHA